MATIWSPILVGLAVAVASAFAREAEVKAPRNSTLESPRLTSWGKWGEWEYCPSGMYAFGMQLQTQSYQGIWVDDQAVTGIRLFCGPVGEDSIGESITSLVGSGGDFNREFLCAGAATGFQLRSEPNQGGVSDDTAANNLRLFCDGKIKEGDGLSFGDWTEPQQCPPKTAICGLRTQVEEPQADGTGVNNIQVQCCPVPNPSEFCEPQDAWDLLLECDNTQAVSETSCTYERKIGATYWNQMSASEWLTYDLYAYIGYSFPGVLDSLAGNFQAHLGQSLSTGYNWTSSSGEVWKEETSVTVSISVPPGVRTRLFQTYGTCDFYAVRANVFKRVDTNNASFVQSESLFTVYEK